MYFILKIKETSKKITCFLLNQLLVQSQHFHMICWAKSYHAVHPDPYFHFHQLFDPNLHHVQVHSTQFAHLDYRCSCSSTLKMK